MVVAIWKNWIHWRDMELEAKGLSNGSVEKGELERKNQVITINCISCYWSAIAF